MDYNAFFPPHEGLRLKEIAVRLGAELSDEAFGDRLVRSIAPVSRAKQDQLCYILSRKNRDELLTCDAAAVICDESLKSIVPDHIPALICKNPHTIFAQAGELLHPSAMRPSAVTPEETGYRLRRMSIPPQSSNPASSLSHSPLSERTFTSVPARGSDPALSLVLRFRSGVTVRLPAARAFSRLLSEMASLSTTACVSARMVSAMHLDRAA